MRSRLRTMLGLAVLAALATAGPAQAGPEATASLSTSEQRGEGRVPAPALSAPLAPGPALAAQRGRRRAGLYLGGGFDRRFVQFVSLRLARSRRSAEERATLVVRCRGSVETLLDNVRLSSMRVRGGRSSGSASFEENVPPDVPDIGGLKRRGVITFRVTVGRGGRAGGAIRNRFTLHDPATDAVRATCDSGSVRWSARMPSRRAGKGRPRPARRTPYFGRTAQRLPFLLRVLRSGRAVRPAGMTFRVGCPSARRRPLDLASTVRMPIFRNGSFGATGAFTRDFDSPQLGPVTESYRWRLAGRFGAAGAKGAWRVSGVVRRVADGQEVARCTTGRNRWRAVR